MARREWRGSSVAVVIGSMAFAVGCGGPPDSPQVLPPSKEVHEAMKKSMREYMEKQMQKQMSKGQRSP